MRDYRDEPVLNCEDGNKEVSVKDALQEARKIMCEMDSMLSDIEANLYGKNQESVMTDRDPQNLLDEAKCIAGFSYDLMSRIKRIKDVLI
jgi:hypothetical protein